MAVTSSQSTVTLQSMVDSVITHGDIDDEKPKDAVRLSVSANLGKTWQNVILPLPSEKYRDGLVECGDPVFLDGKKLPRGSVLGRGKGRNQRLFGCRTVGGTSRSVLQKTRERRRQRARCKARDRGKTNGISPSKFRAAYIQLE